MLGNMLWRAILGYAPVAIPRRLRDAGVGCATMVVCNVGIRQFEIAR